MTVKRIVEEVMHFVDAVLKSIKGKRAGGDVAVMCSFGEMRIKEAVLRAFVAKGCDVFDMNEGTADMCAYGGKMCKSDISFFLCSSGTNLTLRVFGKYGNVIDVKTEREIEKYYNGFKTDENEQFSLNVGRCFTVPMLKLYENMLCSFVCECLSHDSFKDLSVCISNCNGTRILTDVIERFEGKIQPCREGILKIGLANIDGECFARQNEIICDSHHIRAVVMKNIEILGTGVQDYASYSTEALLRIATFKGVSQSDEAKYPLFSDNFLLLLCLLCIIKKTGKSFAELYEEIPGFEVFSDELVGINDRAEIMEKLSGAYSCDSYDSDGVKLKLAQGTVTVIPSRIAGFKIVSEAANAETARELCLKIEDVIKDNSKDKK